jgi:superfamily II DNA or RNA helicase
MHARIPDRGSTVWIRDRKWLVERARIDRNVMRLDVRDRHARLTFLTPYDRPALVRRPHRPRRVRLRSAAAWLAHLSAATIGHTGLGSVLDADLDIFGYQLEPALAVLAGWRRILIADEVGLGKTVQAGVAAAELRRRQGTLHALVICPAALCGQWQDELSTRFSLECRIADGDALVAIGASGPLGETPWQRAGVWIGSYDYLKQPHVLEGMPLAAWDLVILDEAHEAAGPTDRQAACDELARRARHLLLLTATPHSGDTGRFGRLFEMGAHRGADDPLVVFRRTRAGVAMPRTRHVRWHLVRPSREESQLFDALAAYERALLAEAGRKGRDAALLLLSVFRKRALSSAAALACSLGRRLEWLMGPARIWELDWLQPRFEFEGDSVSDDERGALTTDIGWPAAQERAWIRRLQTLAGAATGRETKVRRLVALIERTGEPLVVFTEFRDSLSVLRDRLEPIRPVAVLHGGHTPAERRRELQRFLDGSASVLITTDVGGQGLNLQSRARWVVSLELPWNPTRLEQRIGRVDRIGQARPVHATLLVMRHPGEDTLLQSLSRRALAARRVLGNELLPSLAPPADLVVARALIAAEPLPVGTAASAAVPLARTWRRPARALARLLGDKRALARRWHGRDAGGRARSCAWRHATRRGGSGSAVVAVFTVPITDAAGTELERHLLVLGAGPGTV